jgi:pimeloyl-ACP methyl ester carboxylesterase
VHAYNLAVAEGWIERGGVRLHFIEWRPPRASAWPPLLLLHGLSSNARIWERVALRLPDLHLVALDQRSHGLSDRPPDGYTETELGEDLARLIQELGLGRPLLVGHSWGATVALTFAAARPDLAAGLVMVDGPLGALHDRMPWEEAATRLQPPLPHYRDLAEAVAAQRSALGDAWGEDLLGFVRAGLVERPDGLVPTLSPSVREQVVRRLYHLRPEPLFARVEGPLLLGLAERPWPTAPSSFLEWRRRSAERVEELRPDARLRWYDSPHDIPLVRPEELALDLERTAVAAAFWSLAREAATLPRAERLWRRRVHTGEGGWEARDLLAHLSSTQAALAAVVASAGGEGRGGAVGQPFDPDRWNASQVRRRRERTPPELMEELRSGAVELQAALMAAGLEARTSIGPQAGRPLREALERMHAHQRAHLTELRAALAA